MSKWRDSGDWSYWTCVTCGVEMFDPDTVSVTSCGNGHTNYLGPADPKSQWRRAYTSARARAKDLRSQRIMCRIMHEAFEAGRKQIEAQGRKPRL